MTLIERIEEAKLAFSDYIPCEYRQGAGPRDELVQKCLRQLQKVPEHLQQIMASEGAYIVFFNGPMTDNREMTHLRGVTPEGGITTWDNYRGTHCTKTKAILVGVNGPYGRFRNPFMHELGHSFDLNVGKYLLGFRLSGVNGVREGLATEPFPRPHLNRQREYLAEAFRKFYLSPKSKQELIEHHTKVYLVISEIERRAELAAIQVRE